MRIQAHGEARWFRRPAWQAAARLSSETRRGPGALRASLRACDDGGRVATFAARPQPMTRGASYQHARIKALALVQRHLRDRARPAPEALPLAA